MGVPSFYRWVVKKYPKVSARAVEEIPQVDQNTGFTIPVDPQSPNPNNLEFDNLYLDMNGIIHPCCNPPKPNEEEMFVEIFRYIERIFAVVRPRKVLFMAIDGVAPRAKMNQQRSRRFRAAHDKKMAAIDEGRYSNADEARLFDASVSADGNTRLFDTNCITPGTPFMYNLAKALRTFIAIKLNTDPAWRNLNVILSDANVPGEGEHKIMDFIRSQRSSATHDPNTRHVIHGLDADLIMLALATHEPHFSILREDVLFAERLSNKRKDHFGDSHAANGPIPMECFRCGGADHMASVCGQPQLHSAMTPATATATGAGTGADTNKQAQSGPAQISKDDVPFVFLHVNILREYLEIELSIKDPLPFAFNLERAFDDWVMLCFFVGNDFLPHIPSLEIREGALDNLVRIWKESLPSLGGFITRNGKIDLERLQIIIHNMAIHEDNVFKRRRNDEIKRRIRDKQKAADEEARKNGQRKAKKIKFDGLEVISGRDENRKAAEMMRLEQILIQQNNDSKNNNENEDDDSDNDDDDDENDDAKSDIKKTGEPDENDNDSDNESENASDNDSDNDDALAETHAGTKHALEASVTPSETNAESSTTDEPPIIEGDVKFWEDGYKERYYTSKFHHEYDDLTFRGSVTRSYIEGMCWVLHYYYQGCASWKWYYPFHYAPFAQDFFDISKFDIKFELGTPFLPFEQLMGVLPAASRACVPDGLADLMINEDSSIGDFYPNELTVDRNGQKAEWRGVALLPFVDEKQLLDAVRPKYAELTPEEQQRNSLGHSVMLVSTEHPSSATLEQSYDLSNSNSNGYVELDPWACHRMHGFVSRVPDYHPHSSILSVYAKYAGYEDVPRDTSIQVNFHLPQSLNAVNMRQQKQKEFSANLLRGVKFPPRALSYSDVMFVRSGGRRGRGRGRGGGRGGSHTDTQNRGDSGNNGNSEGVTGATNFTRGGHATFTRGGVRGGHATFTRGGIPGGYGGTRGGRGGHAYPKPPTTEAQHNYTPAHQMPVVRMQGAGGGGGGGSGGPQMTQMPQMAQMAQMARPPVARGGLHGARGAFAAGYSPFARRQK